MRGKPTSRNLAIVEYKDHPRRCGENVYTRLSFSPQGGSPPQVRGKHSIESLAAEFVRITPAGAGKTFPYCIYHMPYRDHPRRCGENTGVKIILGLIMGSPPQVRGKLFERYILGNWVRITPAGAGKTFAVNALCIISKDHPRRCGENAITAEDNNIKMGSPPQVRGKLRPPSDGQPCGGITPAGAGKTLKRSFRNQPFCS